LSLLAAGCWSPVVHRDAKMLVMAPLASPDFPWYNPQLVERARDARVADAGLPGYLGIRILEIGPGRLVAALQVRPELLNPFGSLHGGALAALVDHVLGAVLYPVIEPGAWAATTEFKLNLLAPVREGELTAEAVIVSMTKRTAVVQITVTNQDRLAGLAQGTVLVMPPREPAS
jgi:1,4-dihydroxy-2-naphthoyl-CoA hydrolase